MDALLSLIPESSYPELERYLLGLISDLRKRARTRHISEVCSNNATINDALKAVARRTAHLPDEQALSAMMASVPGWGAERYVAHLQHARKTLKREALTKRNHKIATLARAGYSNSAIAEAVGVSHSTAAKKAAKAVKGENSCA